MARKPNSADENAPVPGERRGQSGFEPHAATTQELATSPVPSSHEDEEMTTHNEPLDSLEPLESLESLIESSTAHGAKVAPAAASMDFDSTSHAPPPEGAMAAIVAEPTPVDTPVSNQALEEIDDGPAPEHTTVDGELLSKIAASPRREQSTRSERDSARGSRPKRRGTDVDQAIAAAAIEAITTNADAEPFDDQSKSQSVSVSRGDGPGSTVILNGDERRGAGGDLDSSAVGRLGPAFPENEDDQPRSSEMPTSARPSLAPAYSGDGPRSAMKTRAGGGGPGLAQGPGSGSITGDVPTADDDGWSDFQEASDEWGRSDSVSAVKPSSRRSVSAQKIPKRKRETGVYGPNEREHPEPIVRLIVVAAEDKGPI
ncbi:MAG TPA: hypothetical protein VLC93_15750, partial [Myxococcota bacterium]|nr:hypothetical protein [Myxococcota bacterium]